VREASISKRVVIGTTDDGKEIFWDMPMPPPLSMKPVEELVQREVTKAFDEYVMICRDKQRRYQLWLMTYYDRRLPEAVNYAKAAEAVENGWDYK
jgi:hypothetical protein